MPARESGRGRVVVIGGGHNGLSAAIALARAGSEVLVLEASDTAGGAVDSAEDTLPGFIHDRGSGFFPVEAATPTQQLLFRPAPELVRHRTPVRGLYLGGASVHPGGGVHGAPGAGAARALLRDRRRRRLGWPR